MQERYTYKFNNGYWKVFDNEQYTDVQICYLRSDAKQLSKKLNKEGTN